MYTIGVNYRASKELASYISRLEAAGHTVIDVKTKIPEQELEMVLIQENRDSDLKDTCQQILTIKNQTDALIWIVSTNFTQINRVIYLQLGADLIINIEQEDTDCFLLQLENTIKKVKKNNKTTNLIVADSKGQKQNRCLQLFSERLSICLDNQQEIQLTPLEFSILFILKENANTVMTYDELFQAIWTDEDKNKQYRINNLIFHLRKKIEKDSKNPFFIKTIRSRGYMLTI